MSILGFDLEEDSSSDVSAGEAVTEDEEGGGGPFLGEASEGAVGSDTAALPLALTGDDDSPIDLTS